LQRFVAPRPWRTILNVLLTLAVFGCFAPSAFAADLVGAGGIEADATAFTHGVPYAHQWTALTTGTSIEFEVYLDSTNMSSNIQVGLYADNSGDPGALLASASKTSGITNGGWNAVNVNTSVTAGTTYWLAAMSGDTHDLIVRQHSSGGCSPGTAISGTTGATTLDSPWNTTGETSTTDCADSIYLYGTAVTAPVNTTAPAVTGTASQGSTLNTTNGSWANSATSYTYQWQDDGTSNIGGATSTTYVAQTSDIGHTIDCVVTATNVAGSTAATTNSTALITGTGPSGGQFGDGGLEPSTTTLTAKDAYAYQWTAYANGTANYVETYLDSGNASANVVVGIYSDSSGAPGTLLGHGSTTSPTNGAWNAISIASPPSIVSGTKYWLAVMSADTNAVKVRQKLTGCSLPGGNLSSDTTDTAMDTPWTTGTTDTSCAMSMYVYGALGSGSAPSNTAVPTISGTDQVGQTLTESDGTWSNNPVSFTYQWQHGGADIPGAISNTYTLSESDVGSTVDLVVTGHNSFGTGTGTSAATSQVVDLAPVNTAVPTISGTAQVGSTLTATTGTWTNSPTSYTYQWQRAGTDISAATSSTYSPVSADVGHTLDVGVTAHNTGGDVAATSAKTASVTAASSTTGASTAHCTGNPGGNSCTTPGTNTDVSMSSISSDCGSGSLPACPGTWVSSMTRTFRVFRPGSMPLGSGNKPPAIIMFSASGGCGHYSFPNWQDLAVKNKLVIVYAEVPGSGSTPTDRGNCTWYKKFVDDTAGTAGAERITEAFRTCTVNGISTFCSYPNDEPYVAALISSITACPGSPTAAQCIDPNRIYTAGGSGGGNMSLDAQCTPVTDGLIRGGLADSSLMQVYNNTVPLTSSSPYPTDQPNCPGVGSGAGQTQALFPMDVVSQYGQDHGIYVDSLANHHMKPLTEADYFANALGCSGSPTTTNPFLTYNIDYTYPTTGCGFATGSAPAVRAVEVPNGTHEWSCQDSYTGYDDSVGGCGDTGTGGTDPAPPSGFNTGNIAFSGGLNVAAEFWSFEAAGTSP
jgi:hypothetical protein